MPVPPPLAVAAPATTGGPAAAAEAAGACLARVSSATQLQSRWRARQSARTFVRRARTLARPRPLDCAAPSPKKTAPQPGRPQLSAAAHPSLPIAVPAVDVFGDVPRSARPKYAGLLADAAAAALLSSSAASSSPSGDCQWGHWGGTRIEAPEALDLLRGNHGWHPRIGEALQPSRSVVRVFLSSTFTGTCCQRQMTFEFLFFYCTVAIPWTCRDRNSACTVSHTWV